MGFIYLMKPVGHNVYKIGETINIEKRMARMQKKKEGSWLNHRATLTPLIPKGLKTVSTSSVRP